LLHLTQRVVDRIDAGREGEIRPLFDLRRRATKDLLVQILDLAEGRLRAGRQSSFSTIEPLPLMSIAATRKA
jgi:hypothetical protein